MSAGSHPTGAPVTVLIRVRNRARTVGRAIRSALAQSLSDQPVVVVDDASTDETRDAVAAFAPRVRLIARPTRGGPGAAAQTGLEAVATPFVAFLDSDDTWDPGYLAAMLDALRAAPGAVMAYGGYRQVYEAAGVEVPVDAPAVPVDAAAALRGFRIPMSAVVGRTAAWQAVGGFRTDVMNGEDKDLQVRLAARDPAGLLRVPGCRAAYHLRADGVTGDFDRYLADALRLLDAQLQMPAFASLRAEAGRLKAARALAIARRRHVVHALDRPPAQRATLIVLADGDAGALAASLQSAEAQRLPPVDVVVAAPPDAALSEVMHRPWPFAVRRIAAPRELDWPTLRRTVAYAQGDLVGFLHAGDRWGQATLDAHRRAHKAHIHPVAFSYAGPVGAAESDATTAILPAFPRACRRAMARDAVPGSLSRMAVDRRLLASLPDTPAPAGTPVWRILAAGLIEATPAPAVRLCQDRAVCEPVNAPGGTALDGAPAI
jgi:hypothetical protein